MEIWLIEDGRLIDADDLDFDEEGMWVLDAEKHLIGDLLKDEEQI